MYVSTVKRVWWEIAYLVDKWKLVNLGKGCMRWVLCTILATLLLCNYFNIKQFKHLKQKQERLYLKHF